MQSEFCVPILNKGSEVIGIIDAESFKKGFMTPEILLQIAKVTMDYGKTNLSSFIPGGGLDRIFRGAGF